MCGIFGEIAIKNNNTSKAVFQSINNFNLLRGPDAEGYWADGETCQLGFRRLAIIDTSANGNQPMISPSGRLVMVFNGEIYNFQEIKLQLKNQHFNGHSDSEVIIHAFEEWGIEKTLKSLDGMFAIAIWDCTEKAITLARDFAGIKPLHYGHNEFGFVFGSQTDQVSNHPWFKDSAIDQQVLYTYLRMHYIPAPLGLLEKTGQLLPGEFMKIDSRGNVTRQFYYQLPNVKPNILKEDEAIEFVDYHLRKSVEAEMISDVPIGTFLSGGIDSPLIASYAAEFCGEPLQAFTIGSDGKTYDESEKAKEIASCLGVSMNLDVMSDKDAVQILPDVMESLKEPFADFSIIPTWLVSKHAKRKITVALSGDGGDELFFGYHRFWSIAKNLKFRNSLPTFLRYPAYGVDKLLFKNRHINSAILADSQAYGHKNLHSRFGHDLVGSIFPYLERSNFSEAFSAYEYPETKDRDELLSFMRKAEFDGMMQKTLLKVDRASMGNSLEVRVPFLKKSFIEASLALSFNLSYGADQRKELLKKLFKKRLPGIVFDNEKKGFAVPLSNWLRGAMKQDLLDTLLYELFISKFGIEKKSMEKLLESHMSGVDEKWPLFTLYSLAKWSCKNA
jgi:asparagine synthase (glutamine-hydrolysing)